MLKESRPAQTRTLRGLEAEYRLAVAEYKGWLARKAREKARALAMATGQVVPPWAQGWGP